MYCSLVCITQCCGAGFWIWQRPVLKSLVQKHENHLRLCFVYTIINPVSGKSKWHRISRFHEKLFRLSLPDVWCWQLIWVYFQGLDWELILNVEWEGSVAHPDVSQWKLQKTLYVHCFLFWMPSKGHFAFLLSAKRVPLLCVFWRQSVRRAFSFERRAGALLFLFIECKARALLCEIGFVAGGCLFHRRHAGRLSLAPVGRNDAAPCRPPTVNRPKQAFSKVCHVNRWMVDATQQMRLGWVGVS